MSGKEIVLTQIAPQADLFVSDIAVLKFKCTDVNGQPLTPSTATMTVRDPQWVLSAPTAAIVNDTITVNVLLTTGGTWKFKLAATAAGAQQGALEGSFAVQKPGF